MSKTLCKFNIAWVGECQNPRPCEKHSELKCVSCNNPATHSCDETGQCVCGEPLCDDCEHLIFPEGDNGGVGFNQQKPPKGLKRHLPKTEQIYQPWYSR